MSSTFPEDVYAEITNAISTLPKGTIGQERDFLRRLRDSTLLNLSLTSREISPIGLSSLRRNVTLNFMKTLAFLLHTKHLANPFVSTRSLIVDLLPQEDEEHIAQEAKHDALEDELGVAHPTLELITNEASRVSDIFMSLPESAPNEPWVSKIEALSRTKKVSTVSAILECMPHLQYLQMSGGGTFQFVRLDMRKDTGVQFSRPLLSLSNLKILRIPPSGDLVIYASNFIWLMIFLENLTHFEVFISVKPEDKRFLLEHEEVLKEKSRISHLDLSFAMISEEKKWPRSLGIDIQSLELLLQVTKGLKELKIHNVRRLHHQDKASMTPSIAFLRAIKSSFKTLKYLALEGDFPHQISRDPAPVHLDSLELLSVNSLRIAALSFPIDFKAPSLKSIAFTGESKGIDELNELSELRALGWIGNPDFPATVKTVYVDGEPNFREGSSQVQSFWENCKKALVELCQTRKIELKRLKAGDQLPFGVMPEPEDLL